MSATKVVVVYATVSKILRRIVLADSDDELVGAVALMPGESSYPMDIADYVACSSAVEFHAEMARRVGEPEHGRCVEVDMDGRVVGAFYGDPELDGPTLHRSHSVESHKTAEVGDVKYGEDFFPTAFKGVV